MKIRKDYDGNEYYNATDAAKYLGMARSTFLYFYDPASTIEEKDKPKYKIHLGKRIWWISDLKVWKNKTSHIQFSYKKRKKSKGKVTETSNVSNFPNPPK
tara:strand:- start:128 stop:427 length:300 start_codon:yes stop_codon:yes gene_type:complete